jgi:chromosome segregation ATPase
VLQERVFEEDQHSLTLNTFSTRKDELVTNPINSQTEHLEGQITTNSYIVESKQMAIRNQHAAQKELPLVIRELDKEKELAYRAKQELAGAEAEVRAVELKIEAKQEELAQSQEKVAEGQSSLEKIRYDIIHQ